MSNKTTLITAIRISNTIKSSKRTYKLPEAFHRDSPEECFRVWWSDTADTPSLRCHAPRVKHVRQMESPKSAAQDVFHSFGRYHNEEKERFKKLEH